MEDLIKRFLVIEPLGYGDGDGDGDGYWEAALASFLDAPVVQEATADGSTVHLALWRSDAKGQPSNGGRTNVARVPGLIEEVAGPLELCSARALHASVAPHKWDGDRWWVVGLFDPIVWKGDKCGSLKRLTVAEIGSAGLPGGS